MKKILIALVICLLLVLSACSPGYDRPAYSPHEDPAQARETVAPVSLLLFYGTALDLATDSRYQEAQSLLSELEQANIPDELVILIDRYHDPCRQMVAKLDDLESLLAQASSLLADNYISEAEQQLTAAGLRIDEAYSVLEELEAANSILGENLGVLAELVGVELATAHERLAGILGELSQLLAEFEQRLTKLESSYLSLLQETTRAGIELILTELSLSVTPGSVYIGDSITVYGELTANNDGLGSRQLTIILEEQRQVLFTDVDGSYIADIIIPYNYVSSMTLKVLYNPSGGDAGTYMAANSPAVEVDTSFYTSQLEASALGDARPGLPFTLSGRLTSSGDSIERNLKLFMGNDLLGEGKFKDTFTFQVTPSPELSIGRHTLTLKVASLERYQGAAESLSINISRIPLKADIQAPPLIILPESISISGLVYHGEGRLQDGRVALTFVDSQTTATTSAYGRFNATIEVPLDLSLFGLQELTITIEPLEPWYESLLISQQIVTLNPAYIGIIFAAFLSVGLLSYRRARTRTSGRQGEAASPSAGMRRPSPAISPPGRLYELSGIRGGVLAAYLQALADVEAAADIIMAPQTTLREFHKVTTRVVPPAVAASFNELTTMAEVAMYSSHKLDWDAVARAEKLAGGIRKELNRGTA